MFARLLIALLATLGFQSAFNRVTRCLASTARTLASSRSFISFKSSRSISSLEHEANNNHDNNNTQKNIIHKCDRDANWSRHEADLFLADFYSRLNNVLACTLETVYFSFVLVRLTVPASLLIGDDSSHQFLFYTLAMTPSLFCAYFVYHIPLSCMATHQRCAQHLGRWHLEPPPTRRIPAPLRLDNRWLAERVYFDGDRVTFAGKVYRTLTDYCTAVPGSSAHRIYSYVFAEPLVVYVCLLTLKVASVGAMLAYLVYNRLWYAVVINMIELGTNFISYYMLVRDVCFLSWKCAAPPIKTTSLTNSALFNSSSSASASLYSSSSYVKKTQ